MMRFVGSLFVLYLLFSSCAFAAPRPVITTHTQQGEIPESQQAFSLKENKVDIPKPKERSIMSQIGVTLVWLLFIIVLIYALAYAFKKVAPPKSGLTNNDAIEVLCKQYIDPKQKLAVVKIHNKVLVLGVGSNGITKISEFDNEEDVAFFTATYSLGNKNIFSRMMNKEQQKLLAEDDELDPIVNAEERLEQKIKEVRSSLSGDADIV